MRLKTLLAVFFLSALTAFGKEVKYEVSYGLFPAGVIKIYFQPDRVVVKGKSGGLLGWFYKYRLYMVYDLKNPAESYMEEEENGKHRKYDYQRILKKKAWLPLVVKILLTHRGFSEKAPLKVGNYEVILQKVEGNDYYFSVNGSKKTKEIKLFGWKNGDFPEKIEIETSSGTLVLKRD